MRAVLVAILGAAILFATTACGGSSKPTYPINVYIAGKHIVSVPANHTESFLPKVIVVQLGYMNVTVNVNKDVADRIVQNGLDHRLGRVNLPYTPKSSIVNVDSQKVLFKHDTEVTALSMLLTAAGIDAPQVRLAPTLKTNGPPAPVMKNGIKMWGDPDLGLVGRYNAKIGFGVYVPPIKRLAAKEGVHLVDFTGKSLADLRKALLTGHPIMAWIGGTKPRPDSWVTPSGKKITVDLGEQAVTIIGAGPGFVTVNDPVTGKRYNWGDAQFDKRWALLGRRALELP